MSAPPSAVGRGVSLITRHGAVLLQLEREPDLTVEELARRLGVSTRTIRRVITQLEESGVLTRERKGNRNRYRIDRSRPADGSAGWFTVGEFLERLAPLSR